MWNGAKRDAASRSVALLQLCADPALVVVLYCIAFPLGMQYNTTYNATHATIQHELDTGPIDVV